MPEHDTIRLLRECDAGLKMGAATIDEVLGRVTSRELKQTLTDSKHQHERLDHELQDLLNQYHDEGKTPGPVAKSMSWIKTNMTLGWDGSDKSIADLVTDGCNGGVKSLYQYLNQYTAADQGSQSIALRLIRLEEQLAADVRKYL